MLKSLRIAAVCLDSKPGRMDENLEKIDAWADKAAQEGAQLVVFPELSLTGFIPNHPTGEHDSWLRRALAEARRLAQVIDGQAVQRVQQIAQRHDVLLSVGMLEDAGAVLYNTQILVGPSGTMGRWRKMHVPMYEMPFYNPGDGPKVAELREGRLGVNICFDALLPESARLLAIQNVEIILFPFAADPPPGTAQGWSAWAGPAIRARCVENGVFGVAVNYMGEVELAGAQQTFPGGALIIGPRGETIADSTDAAGNKDLLIAELRHETLTAARAEPEYLFRFRRPELYGPLAE